jgi:vancomycin permeability regulator SanA
MKWFRRILLTLVALGLVGLLSIYLINRHVRTFADEKMQTSITKIPVEDPRRVAVVFGAGVRNNGEVSAMELGVPEQDIVLDFAGRRTFDTCYRAKEIFEVKRAILVTQEFHQARALYLCNNLGLDSIGITANRRIYEGQGNGKWAFREFFSVASAWFEINFMKLDPIGGPKEPIPQ